MPAAPSRPAAPSSSSRGGIRVVEVVGRMMKARVSPLPTKMNAPGRATSMNEKSSAPIPTAPRRRPWSPPPPRRSLRQRRSARRDSPSPGSCAGSPRPPSPRAGGRRPRQSPGYHTRADSHGGRQGAGGPVQIHGLRNDVVRFAGMQHAHRHHRRRAGPSLRDTIVCSAVTIARRPARGSIDRCGLAAWPPTPLDIDG